MCLRPRIRVLACAAFLFAARLPVPAPAAETSGQPQPQAQQVQQARQTNATATAPALMVPAGAMPAPAMPQIDNARNIPGLSPGEIGGLTLPSPAAAPAVTPATTAPQNRVLPANASNNIGNTGNANPRPDSTPAPTSTPASTAYSPTWLIDGVRQLEMESRQRLRANAANENGAANNSATSESAPAPDAPTTATAATAPDNPLAAYLDKWITTPEGAAAVRAMLSRETGGIAAGAVNARPGSTSADTTAPNATNAFSPAGAAMPSAPGAPASAGGNPYIDDLFQPQMDTKGMHAILLPPPIPEAQPSQTQSAAEAQAPASAPAPAEPPIDTSKLILKPIAPPPTTPVINDKKYFPQLDRF